ncbi:MAG: lipid-A-disaccharide synthase [Pseudomonadales bacterium]|nr:lipid-A-disaccharide synthase [Pseudomonadales bacterium]
MPKLKVAIIAGEASGDILGGGLIEAFKARYPDAEFYGIGGDLMIAQGLAPVAAMEQLSVMGLFEVLARLPSLLKLRKKLIADFISSPPDLFIGIDAPDFNLNIELALKKAGILTVHYVSPSVWAWKHKRIYKIKQAVDLLLTLFPFEQQHYSATSQKIAFVGHPLAKLIPQQYDQDQYKLQLGFKTEDTLVALLPGSRSSETKYLTPVFLRTAQLLCEKHPQVRFVLPAANQYRYDEIALLLQAYRKLPVRLILQDSRTAMAAADAILIASGTATLEAALLAKPMVVAYKMAALTYAIYSRMLRVKYISLPNLLADEMLVPERLQNQANPELLCDELEQALFNKQRRDYQISKLKQIHQQLDLPANERAVDAIVDLLKVKTS